MHLQESGEMYLETIYILSKERNGVRSIDVVERYNKPSVFLDTAVVRRTVVTEQPEFRNFAGILHFRRFDVEAGIQTPA